MAAQPLVDTALINIHDTLDSNIHGAINLLQSCVNDPKLEGMIFVTTDKVYGNFDGVINETAPLLGIGNPYDTSKVCADILAQMYAKVFKIPLVIIRSGNIYGPGDKHWDRLIPGTFMSCLLGKNPIIRSDGTFTRDYIYIEDIIDAYILLAEKIHSDLSIIGKAINIGAEDKISVLDIVHYIITIMGQPDLYVKIQNTAKFEIPHQHLNWELAKKMGWKPKINITKGLRLSKDYYVELYAGEYIND